MNINAKNIKRTKSIALWGVILTFFLLLPVLNFAKGGSGVKTVVIDAGHGGKDPGAIGPGKTREKDIALKVALMLGTAIKANHPDVNVIYTRSTDIFLELFERAEIANRAKADLFIAIHINASVNANVKGSSTYVLGLHKSDANLDVAKRENAVIELEVDRDKNYEFNPNSPEGHIIMSMKQNAYLEQSISMASLIEKNQEGSAENRHSMGVKQAGFYVLYKTAMPSILTEIGFVSNPWEEKYLASEEGQYTIADNIYKAFADYKQQIEGNSYIKPAPIIIKKDTLTVKSPPLIQDSVLLASKNNSHSTNSSSVSVVDTFKLQSNSLNSSPTRKDTVPFLKPVVSKKDSTPTISNTKPFVKDTIPKQPVLVKGDLMKNDSAKLVKQVSKDTLSKVQKQPDKAVLVKETANQTSEIVDIPIVFRVQIGAARNPTAQMVGVTYSMGSLITEEIPGGIKRFMIGDFAKYSDAELILKQVKPKVPDAFIIGYNKGVRLTAQETIKYK